MVVWSSRYIWYIYIHIQAFVNQAGARFAIPARDHWQVGVLTADELTCSRSTTAMYGGCDITPSPKSSRKMINWEQKFFLWKHKIKGTVVSQNRRWWANIDLEVSWESIANCISHTAWVDIWCCPSIMLRHKSSAPTEISLCQFKFWYSQCAVAPSMAVPFPGYAD